MTETGIWPIFQVQPWPVALVQAGGEASGTADMYILTQAAVEIIMPMWWYLKGKEGISKRGTCWYC